MASATVFAAIPVTLSAGSGQLFLPGCLQYLFKAAVQDISRESQDHNVTQYLIRRSRSNQLPEKSTPLTTT